MAKPQAKGFNYKAGFRGALDRIETRAGPGLTAKQKIIPAEMTFRQWCEKLAGEGLKVDGKPFTLDNRAAMAWVYDQFPSSVEEAFGQVLVLMKCAQVGFTLLEMLFGIYAGLKFMPCFVGFYLPDMKLAAAKSTVRFMPVIRTIPDAYKRLRSDLDPAGRKTGEGNVMIRQMAESRFHFLWTSGKAMTESFPLDILSFDEVQEMLVDDMEKTAERLSGSSIKFEVMGSTAKWPDADIDYWFKLGTRHEFWTLCPTCGRHFRMDAEFPDCVRYDAATENYRYACKVCKGWIDDPQTGDWIPENPTAAIKSIHFHQMLSPTVSAREVILKYDRATNMQNFYNRVLGKPYSDPSEMPINMEILNQCVAAGREAGVEWKPRARNTYCGIDQMGAYNVVIIKERLPDGRQAVIHVEEIYSKDPFARCDELMAQFGVEVCCVETLPNYNDAKRFSGRHPGRVYLAGYADLRDDMLQWGDAIVTKADRKTEIDERDRYVVTLNQYKCMQVAFARMQNKTCLFPDPDGLVQEIVDRGQKRLSPILRERVFLHFTKTALVTERDPEGKQLKKFKTKVVKVGIDPHFSYANMLCDVAWARSHGTGSFIMAPLANAAQDRRDHAVGINAPGLPTAVIGMMEQLPPGEICGRCEAYEKAAGRCRERNLFVGASDAGCPLFVQGEAS